MATGALMSYLMQMGIPTFATFYGAVVVWYIVVVVYIVVYTCHLFIYFSSA